ncbi:MAG TPA: hypothetical protein VJR89_01560, partial [Polyangiales bacterium]|nr:hypothetical protein [Polyangiales bacterium]
EQRSMLVNAAGGEWSELDVSATQSENPWEQVEAPAKPPVVVNVSEVPPPAAAAAPVPFEAVPASEPVADEASADGDALRSAIVPAMFGGAAIAAGFAIWQWRVREDEVDAWNSDECLKNGQTRLENCGGHQSAYQSAQTWAWVAASTAVALSAGAVLWMVLDQPAKAEAQAAANGCVPGALAVSCRMKF